MLQTSISLLASLLATAGTAPDVPISLSGSPQSMERQHAVAVASGYEFLRTPGHIRFAIDDGELVHIQGNDDFALKYPDDAVTRPEVVHFIERFAAEYRSGCGERLVITSLTRPLSRQPRNAHRLSVHPAGMAMDLRVPSTARCRKWLEASLLEMEQKGVLDVTRERRPAHYHVALFPEPYLAHLGLREPGHPQVVPTPTRAPVPEPVLLMQSQEFQN